jgi:RNA polymerase sigma factor for flagellar operon FliA
VSHELEGRVGRPPTEEEIARELDLSLAQYQELLGKVGEMTLFSLEDLGFGGAEERISNDGEDEEADADPLRALLSMERVHLVADAIGRLPEREKLVIALYYNEDLTMKEVGGVLGLTESRVSQLHSQAMLRLKRYLLTKLAKDEPGA